MNNTGEYETAKDSEGTASTQSLIDFADAGLNINDNNTTRGRDSFYEFSSDLPSVEESIDYGVHDEDNLFPRPNLPSFTLDVVQSNNQAGTATFNGSVTN